MAILCTSYLVLTGIPTVELRIEMLLTPSFNDTATSYGKVYSLFTPCSVPEMKIAGLALITN